MQVIKEFNGFYDLKENSWSGAIDTLNVIAENDMETEFMDFLEMYFCDSVPTETELNDLLWFEDEYIFEQLGIERE